VTPVTLDDQLALVNQDQAADASAATALQAALAAATLAQTAKAATANALAGDTSSFAHSILSLGGEVLAPATGVVYASSDGATFTSRTLPTLSATIPSSTSSSPTSSSTPTA
jgi:hypothetical protein